MTKVHIRVRGNGHQPLWGTAFKKGLERHGHIVTMGPQYASCDLLVLWGIHSQDLISLQRAKGKVCILERGYLGDCFEYTSVSFGGNLNGKAEFHSAHNEPSRYQDIERRYGPFPGYHQGLRFGEGPILIIGQKPGDMSHRHIRIDDWYRTVERDLGKKEKKFRAHPLDKTVAARRAPLLPLRDDLDNAKYVITLNSNTCVEALAYGRPLVTCEAGSMAYSITSHDVNKPLIPTLNVLQEWFNRLAWKQWTLSEMESGECWDAQRLYNAKD